MVEEKKIMTEDVTVMSLRFCQPELADRLRFSDLQQQPPKMRQGEGGEKVCIQQQLNVKSSTYTSKVE